MTRDGAKMEEKSSLETKAKANDGKRPRMPTCSKTIRKDAKIPLRRPRKEMNALHLTRKLWCVHCESDLKYCFLHWWNRLFGVQGMRSIVKAQLQIARFLVPRTVNDKSHMLAEAPSRNSVQRANHYSSNVRNKGEIGFYTRKILQQTSSSPCSITTWNSSFAGNARASTAQIFITHASMKACHYKGVKPVLNSMHEIDYTRERTLFEIQALAPDSTNARIG